ncbi:hypothetical protein ACEPAI_8200 [Sanghuangporus weigelae]
MAQKREDPSDSHKVAGRGDNSQRLTPATTSIDATRQDNRSRGSTATGSSESTRKSSMKRPSKAIESKVHESSGLGKRVEWTREVIDQTKYIDAEEGHWFGSSKHEDSHDQNDSLGTPEGVVAYGPEALGKQKGTEANGPNISEEEQRHRSLITRVEADFKAIRERFYRKKIQRVGGVYKTTFYAKTKLKCIFSDDCNELPEALPDLPQELDSPMQKFDLYYDILKALEKHFVERHNKKGGKRERQLSAIREVHEKLYDVSSVRQERRDIEVARKSEEKKRKQLEEQRLGKWSGRHLQEAYGSGSHSLW